MAVIPGHKERFYENMVDFTHLLKSLIEKTAKYGHNCVNPIFVNIAMAIIEGYNKDEIISNFIFYSHKYWDRIHRHDETFMKENSLLIFEGIPKNHIDSFKMIFDVKTPSGNFIIDNTDKMIIWEFFESFIKISIKYIHDKRESVARKIGGETRISWTKHYMDEIDLQDEAIKWKVALHASRQE